MMDMHCHVDLYPEHDEILKDIDDCNFYVLSVTTVPSAYEGTVNLTRNLKNCRTALGLHPQLAHQRQNELELFDHLICKTRYIGEVGLDGSKGFRDYLEEQEAVFNHILRKCEEFDNKILTIHSLNAVEETLACLEHFPNAGKPIFHWFLGTKKQIEKAYELGGYFSIGPAMLHSIRGKKVISWIPKERILLETDGPFAKVENEILFPSDVASVVDYLSFEWNQPKSEVMKTLSENLRTLVSHE